MGNFLFCSIRLMRCVKNECCCAESGAARRFAVLFENRLPKTVAASGALNKLLNFLMRATKRQINERSARVDNKARVLWRLKENRIASVVAARRAN